MSSLWQLAQWATYSVSPRTACGSEYTPLHTVLPGGACAIRVRPAAATQALPSKTATPRRMGLLATGGRHHGDGADGHALLVGQLHEEPPHVHLVAFVRLRRVSHGIQQVNRPAPQRFRRFRGSARGRIRI